MQTREKNEGGIGRDRRKNRLRGLFVIQIPVSGKWEMIG